MSRHEGISCDICMSSNFAGVRYKCLRCYDFDLCANCFNSGITSSRHSNDHPMQRILTRNDTGVFYGGENSTSQPHAYCCSYCGRMGFTVVSLVEHIQNEHAAQSYPEVLCPVCAAHPDADPNHMTDDLGSHLALIHPNSAADLDSDQLADIKHLRRHNQSANRSSNNQSGGATPTSMGGGGGTRNLIRGSLLHLIDPGLPLTSMGVKDVMDPITELLSHLNSVRGRLAGNVQGVSNHLQQLGVHLSSGRNQVPASNLEQTRSANQSEAGARASNHSGQEVSKNNPPSGTDAHLKNNQQFLLVKCLGTDESISIENKAALAQRPHFVQELLSLCPTLTQIEGQSAEDEKVVHSPASTSSTSFTRLPLSSSTSSTSSSSPASSTSPSPVHKGAKAKAPSNLRDASALALDASINLEVNGSHDDPEQAAGPQPVGYRPEPGSQRKRYDRVREENGARIESARM